MTLDETVIKRLAFIKYLYKVGVEHSKKPEPLSSASLLIFQDAVELFLQLASEHLGISKKEVTFMEYWELLSQKLEDREITQKEAMRRLHDARGSLKHRGTRPSNSDIEAFRASSTNFFNENTQIVFDIEFSDISLIELVQCEDAKNNLKEAEKLLKENRIGDALDKIALAFAQLIDDYESGIIGRYGRSPFYFGEPLLVDPLHEAVKILSLDINYRRYVKFRLLTPEVSSDLEGNLIVFGVQWGSKGMPTMEEVQFCIDFVIESAITLQELDFSVK